MRLTKKLLFAIEAVLDIAYHSAHHPVQSKDIADRQGIPRRYLEQVLQHLVRAQILKGVRGPRGGYRLAREPRRITVWDIIGVVDQMEGAQDPLDEASGGELGSSVLRPIWNEIEAYAMLRLSQLTIDDLCASAKRAGIESQAEAAFDFTP